MTTFWPYYLADLHGSRARPSTGLACCPYAHAGRFGATSALPSQALELAERELRTTKRVL
jgi:hypothetical protein